MADGSLFKHGAHLKRCSKCGEKKPRSEFNKRNGRERSSCKICHRAEVRLWQKKTHSKRAEYEAAWRNKNRDHVRAYARKYYREKMTDETRVKKNIDRRRRHLARKYGLLPDEWQAMFVQQGGVCALCQIPGRLGRHGKLSVDHCHETGRVRGLLCTSCNISLGILGDTPEKMERTMAYLRGDLIRA